MQGGIHPDFDGHTYLAILAAAKEGAPGIHVHAFSPLEVQQGAATLGWPVPRCRSARAATVSHRAERFGALHERQRGVCSSQLLSGFLQTIAVL